MRLSAAKYIDLATRCVDLSIKNMQLRDNLETVHQIVLDTLSDDPKTRDEAHEVLYKLANEIRELRYKRTADINKNYKTDVD